MTVTATPATISHKPLTVAPRQRKLQEVVPGVFTNARVNHLMVEDEGAVWNPIENKWEL